MTAAPTIVSMGHTINLSIEVLDQNGNVMLTPPAFDSPPVWTDTTPATEALAFSANGQTAVATPITPGTDVINLSCSIGGKALTASLDIEIDAAPQIPTAVQILAVIQ